jgi:hypothetical protein
VVGESEKLEGTLPTWSTLAGWTLEAQQPSLLRMKLEPVDGQSLRKHVQYPAGVVLQLAADQKVVCEANQERASA